MNHPEPKHISPAKSNFGLMSPGNFKINPTPIMVIPRSSKAFAA